MGLDSPAGRKRVFSWIVSRVNVPGEGALYIRRAFFLFVFGFAGPESLVIMKEDRSRSVVQVDGVWHDADG